MREGSRPQPLGADAHVQFIGMLVDAPPWFLALKTHAARTVEMKDRRSRCRCGRCTRPQPTGWGWFDPWPHPAPARLGCGPLVQILKVRTGEPCSGRPALC